MSAAESEAERIAGCIAEYAGYLEGATWRT